MYSLLWEFFILIIIHLLRKMWGAYTHIQLLALLSMYNNDHHDGDNGLIPQQIPIILLAEEQIWLLCTFWECAVGHRVLTVEARLSRWMGPRFKGHQRTSLIRLHFLWFDRWLIKRNTWRAFPSSPPFLFLSPPAFTHIWKHHILSLTSLFIPPDCGKVGGMSEQKEGDEWQVPDQLSFSGSNWSWGGRGGRWG